MMTSNIAPAHLHATGVAVYPPLFSFTFEKIRIVLNGGCNLALSPPIRLLLPPENLHHCSDYTEGRVCAFLQ